MRPCFRMAAGPRSHDRWPMGSPRPSPPGCGRTARWRMVATSSAPFLCSPRCPCCCHASRCTDGSGFSRTGRGAPNASGTCVSLEPTRLRSTRSGRERHCSGFWRGGWWRCWATTSCSTGFFPTADPTLLCGPAERPELRVVVLPASELASRWGALAWIQVLVALAGWPQPRAQDPRAHVGRLIVVDPPEWILPLLAWIPGCVGDLTVTIVAHRLPCAANVERWFSSLPAVLCSADQGVSRIARACRWSEADAQRILAALPPDHLALCHQRGAPAQRGVAVQPVNGLPRVVPGGGRRGAGGGTTAVSRASHGGCAQSNPIGGARGTHLAPDRHPRSAGAEPRARPARGVVAAHTPKPRRAGR